MVLTHMTERAQKPSATAKRKAARLMAVQAVYQMSVNKEKPAPMVIDEYLYLRKNMEIEGETMVEPDGTLFTNIVSGVSERLGDLSGIIQANRPVKEHGHSDEPLLMAVLLCGTYELLAHGDIDVPIIISGYVDVAKAFFSGPEPSLVNAILDSIRKVTRA